MAERLAEPRVAESTNLWFAFSARLPHFGVGGPESPWLASQPGLKDRASRSLSPLSRPPAQSAAPRPPRAPARSPAAPRAPARSPGRPRPLQQRSGQDRLDRVAGRRAHVAQVPAPLK